MAHGAPANVWLGQLIHENGTHHAALYAALFKRVLQSDGVDHGGEHAHAVGAHAIHLPGLSFDAAENVTSAHHNSNFHAQGVNFSQLAGNLRHFFRINAETARPCQRLT